MSIKLLPVVHEDRETFDKLEQELVKLIRQEIYLPLVNLLGLRKNILKNSTDDLLEAIRSGRITFYRGEFKGRFDAKISKELKRLGAKWDRRHGSWTIPQSSLPLEVSDAIRVSAARFEQVLGNLDKKLKEILPEQIASKLNVSKVFDATLWDLDKKIKKSVKGISISPEVSPVHRKQLASDYTNNLQLDIKDWADAEIKKLRKSVQSRTFSGHRYEGLAKEIQKSYDVGLNKAKFLARQETGLLTAKFKKLRYTEAGVPEYKWMCVAGSSEHPVRPMHKALEGKIFRWDDPPITDDKGSRNNPREDYNCRCYAIPIVRFTD